MKVNNPIVFGARVKRVGSYKINKIINDYKELGVKTKRLFGKLKDVYLYECEVTAYQFFWPKSIVGDGKFYEDLSKHDWYYSNWRWEHEISSKLLTKSDSVLEVGCGSGFFLDGIKTKVKNVVGLELNEDAIKQGLEKGLDIKNETIQDFAEKNKNKYSIVCSYQVLEHVIDIGVFIKSCLDCLKPGGKLLISVPNNTESSLIVNDGILNLPPHHMGRWNAVSLANIAQVYGLKIEKMLFEPAGQDFQGVYRKYTENQINHRHPVFYQTFKPILKHLVSYFVNINSPYLQGHSVFVEYRKL